MKNDLVLIFATFMSVLGISISFIKVPSSYWDLIGIFASSLLIVFLIRMIPTLKKSSSWNKKSPTTVGLSLFLINGLLVPSYNTYLEQVSEGRVLLWHMSLHLFLHHYWCKHHKFQTEVRFALMYTSYKNPKISLRNSIIYLWLDFFISS